MAVDLKKHWWADHVAALGEYAPRLAPHLHMPAVTYRNTPLGALVLSTLFHCIDGQQAFRLAAALRVRRDDAKTFQFDPHNVAEERLEQIFPSRFDSSMTDFRELRRAGFVFFFVPSL